MKLPWEKLARAETHPLRVAILEAICSSPEPQSSITLHPFVGSYTGQIRFHLTQLEKNSLIELVDKKQRRGATEMFYRAVSS